MRQDQARATVKELPRVLDTEGLAAGCNFPQHGGYLRAISNSSGSSVLSFCMAMSAMGPRITTGRLKLAVGRRRSGSGKLRARAELAAPRAPAPLLEVPAGLGLIQGSGAHCHLQWGSPGADVPWVSLGDGDSAPVPTFLQDHPLIGRVVALLGEGRQVLAALPQHFLGSPQAPQLPELGPCPGGVGTRCSFHR